MQLVERFLAAQAVFAERVHAVAPHQWVLATPDDEWTVADLVDHVVGEQRWVVPLLAGRGLEESASRVDAASDLVAGDDPATAWDDASSSSALAVRAPGALDRDVALVRGPTAAIAYVTELIFDLVVHAWDLCRAIGYGVWLPDAVVEPVWAESKDFVDLSASGLFDLPVEIPDDAPTIYRLVAMTGRNPL